MAPKAKRNWTMKRGYAATSAPKTGAIKSSTTPKGGTKSKSSGATPKR